jgi:hypothetical protein
MENLGRSIIRNRPENILEYSAWYLEEKLKERNTALENLPKVSYLQKLKQRKFENKPSTGIHSSKPDDDAEDELIVNIEDTSKMAASAHTFPMTKSVANQGKAKSVEEFISHTLTRTADDKGGSDTPVALQASQDQSLRLATGENSDSIGQEDAHESHEHTLLVESEQGLVESQGAEEKKSLEASKGSRERMPQEYKAETPQTSQNKIVVKEKCDSQSEALVERIGTDEEDQRTIETCTGICI